MSGAIAESIKVAQALPDQPSALALMHSDPLKARPALEAQTRRHPADKNAWHNLGLLHLQADDQALARDCFARVLELDPQDSFAICRLIETSSLLKDIDAVERWCKVLREMPGGRIPAAAFFARALVHCDQYDRARVFMEDALRKFPAEPDLLIGYGDVLRPWIYK